MGWGTVQCSAAQCSASLINLSCSEWFRGGGRKGERSQLRNFSNGHGQGNPSANIKTLFQEEKKRGRKKKRKKKGQAGPPKPV